MSDNWFLLSKKLENVKLGDGSVVNAYLKSFDYSLIWYPNPRLTPEEKYPHSWSYARMVLGGDGYGTRDWSKNHRRVPYYPDDAESPAGNYLGREFVPGTEPETDPPVDSIPELSNYFGDDHLAFVHLPDPTNDDNPSTAQAHRDKILSFLSLKRQTDPTFDCRVAPTSGGTGCEFCPNGKSEGPYRQFTSHAVYQFGRLWRIHADRAGPQKCQKVLSELFRSGPAQPGQMSRQLCDSFYRRRSNCFSDNSL